MPYYKLGNKKGQTIVVKASDSDSAKRAALKAGLAPDEYATSWTGRPRKDYTIIKRSTTKIENPSTIIKSPTGWIRAKAIKIVRGKLLIKR